jgi:hypothetical protein
MGYVCLYGNLCYIPLHLLLFEDLVFLLYVYLLFIEGLTYY